MPDSVVTPRRVLALGPSEAVWHCTIRTARQFGTAPIAQMSVFPTRIRWRSVWAAARRRAAAARSLQTSRRATVTTQRSLATTPPQHGLDDVGAANLDWPRLGFDFQKTNGFVKHTWVNGRWDEGEWEPEPFLKLHVMSAADPLWTGRV